MKLMGKHISASIESPTLGLDRSHQKGISHIPDETDRQCKYQSCGQKARQLFPEAHSGMARMDLHGNCPESSCDVVQKRCLLPSGSVNLSCHESQEPDEESLANALNMVDKLVWSNSACMSQETERISTLVHDSLKDGKVPKGLRALAHTAEKRAVLRNMDVYDWADSQQEEPGLSCDLKGDPALPLQLQNIIKIKHRKPTRGMQKQAVKTASSMSHTREDCNLACSTKKVVMGSDGGNGMEPCIVLTRRRRDINVEAVHSKKSTPHIFKKGGKQKSDDMLYLNNYVDSNRGVTDVGSDTQSAIEVMTILRHDISILAQFDPNFNGIEIKSGKCDGDGLNVRKHRNQLEFTRLTNHGQLKHPLRKKRSVRGENFVNAGLRTRSKANGFETVSAKVLKGPRTRQRKPNIVCIRKDMPSFSYAPPVKNMELEVLGRHVPVQFAAEAEEQNDGNGESSRGDSMPRKEKRKRKHHEIKSLEQRKGVFGDDLESGMKAAIYGMTIAQRTRSSLMDRGLVKSDMPMMAASKDYLILSRNGGSKIKQNTGNIKPLIPMGLVTRSQSQQQKGGVRNTKQFMPPCELRKKARHVRTMLLASAEAPSPAGEKNKYNEGSRKKQQPGNVSVLLSHSLPKEMVKHQKKILAKLGGRLVKKAANCTHFVTNYFVRSRNMLESIAAGKAIVTPTWLESCGQACYFVDEKNYILQDLKKEKELHFSLEASLLTARRKPLLKGSAF